MPATLTSCSDLNQSQVSRHSSKIYLGGGQKVFSLPSSSYVRPPFFTFVLKKAGMKLWNIDK